MSTKNEFTWLVSATIEQGKVSDFTFTPSSRPRHALPTPHRAEAYHNVFGPITKEGIQEATAKLREVANRCAPVPFFPDGAISLIHEAIRHTGLNRRSIRVEWIEEHATVKAFVSDVNANDIDAIMEQAIPMMPLGIGIDIHAEVKP